MSTEPDDDRGARATLWRTLTDPPGLARVEADRARRARLLYRILLAAYPVLVLLTAVAWMGPSHVAHVTYPLQCLLVFLVLVLVRWGYPSVATGLALLSVWGLSSVTIVEEGGVGSAAIGSYALLVLMAGFFWHFRGALVVAALSVASVAVLIWAPGWVGLAPFTRSDAGRYFAETTAQILVTAFLLQFALEFIRQAASERHHAELLVAEARLELEQRRRETQKFEAIGRLAGGVAHDLKNLLTVILGEAELARRPGATIDLSAIEEAAFGADRLASQLLAVGRKQELSPREVDLNALLESQLGVLRGLATSAVSIELDLCTGQGLVEADPHQLERVFINLVKNASEAMHGSGVVRIRTRREAEQFRVVVEDQGPGMSADVQARIFEPFFTTKGDAGTGLGLATAHGIIEQSGGRLVAESRVGEGTRMHVLLPLGRAS